MFAGRGRLCCALVAVCVFFLANRAAQGASPAGTCPDLRPLLSAGRTDPLGVWVDTGVQCTSGPWAVQLGGRYTQVTQAEWEFAVLSYTTPFFPEWHLNITASSREHGGDYEISRLPELTLEWAPPSPGSFIIPTVDLLAGWIEAIQPQSQTFRTGARVTFATPAFKISAFDWSISLQLGDYNYGTGQSTSFWIGTVNTTLHLSPSVDLGALYLQQNGSGVSPLVYDFTGYDQYVVGSLGATLSPVAKVSLAVTFNIASQPSLVRDVILSWTRPSDGWSIGVGQHQANGQLFFSASLPP